MISKFTTSVIPLAATCLAILPMNNPWRAQIIAGLDFHFLKTRRSVPGLARPWSCMAALQLEVTPPGDPYHSIDPHGFGVLGAMVIALLMMGPVLDAACNHSAFGYSWLVELNAEERQADERGGRAFLDWLAHDIHNGVPILKVNTSPYKARNRSVEYADETNRAVEASRTATPPSRK